MQRIELIASEQIIAPLYKTIADDKMNAEDRETLVTAFIDYIKDLNQKLPEFTPISAKFCDKTKGKYSTQNDFIDINCVIYQTTCLILAAQRGYVNIVRMLVAANANPAFELPFLTPLDSAVQSGSQDTVKYLLEQKASVEFLPKQHIRPITHRAVERGHATILQTLLDHKASVDLKDHCENTALMCAIQAGRETTCVDILIKRNADTELKNDQGQNAVDFLKLYRPFSMIQLFLEAGKIQQVVVWHIFQDMDCSNPDYLYWLNIFAPHLPPEAAQFLEELTAFKYIVDAHFPKKYLDAIKKEADRFFPDCERLIHDYTYYPLEDIGLFKPTQLRQKHKEFLAANKSEAPVVKKKTPGST